MRIIYNANIELKYKNVEHKFTEIASTKQVKFIGNVKVGIDIPLSVLSKNYNALLFSYGASYDKNLGIEGEDLSGIISARDFVGWYNGLPEFQNITPNLSKHKSVSIIGHGNVALDVARILLSDPKDLVHTDITNEAIEELKSSSVKEVNVIGRRSILQASFTVKEVRELMAVEGVGFKLNSSLAEISEQERASYPRQLKRMMEVIQKGSKTPLSMTTKWWNLYDLLSPVKFNGTGGNLNGITFEKNVLETSNSDLRTQRALGTGEFEYIESTLCFKSIGYKSVALHGSKDIGLPFNEKYGIIPNESGRVIGANGHLPGLYASGWVKRGPTGVIASTMWDAYETADILADDWESQKPFLSNGSSVDGWESVYKEVNLAKPYTTWDDWSRIDAFEKEQGKLQGKERLKITDIDKMLKISGH